MTPAVTIEEVAPDDPDVAALRERMGEEAARRYDRPRFSAPAEGIDPSTVVVTLLMRSDDRIVGTGALRRLGPDLEVKRMFVDPDQRGRGLGRMLLTDLEARAREVGAPRLLLHTGERQPEALALYRASGFTEVPVFEPYLSVPESVCFAKGLHETAPV